MQNNQVYFRSQYPFLNSGHIYFNHAATSPLSIPVRKRIEQFIEMRTTGAIDDYRMILDCISSAKEKTAQLLQVAPERIAFVDNTTNGLNILAQGFPWKSGDEIILNTLEFPANVYPFLNLQNRGVRVVFAEAHHGIVSAEDIIAKVTPRTRLISISFVQFLTGYRADMKMLGTYCREHDIVFCVDAIQGLGALRLSAADCLIDFISCGTQKWLMSNMGLAFIYLSASLQERLHVANAGWLSVEGAWNLLDFQLIPKQTAEAFQPGTLNAMGIFGYLGALEFFEESGEEAREQVILDNTEYLMARLNESGFQPLLLGVQRGYLSGITTIIPKEPERLFNLLLQKNITASLREGMIRFAPHYYNTREEIDTVVGVLSSLL